MIQMPRRSVTRFFIPLIDVLLLLFCIFLLMEFGSSTEVKRQVEVISEQTDALAFLQDEVNQRTRELRQFEEDRPKLLELDKLRDELDRLRKASQRDLQEQVYVRIIDIDGKDGSISCADDRRPNAPIIPIRGPGDAKKLIERHQKEAAGRQVYYYFLYPRDGRRFPTTAGQEQDYRNWFKGAANSLVKVGS